jgi:hypothetical protein
VSALTFLDTGYLLALELAKDQNHRAAARHWQGFLRQQPRLVTTTFVFDDGTVSHVGVGRYLKWASSTKTYRIRARPGPLATDMPVVSLGGG